MTTPEPTPGAKMMYLIRRRTGVSREALIAHWFAHHMPAVIRGQELQASAGRLAATRYIATVFDAPPAGAMETLDWDGVAQLWFPEALPMPGEPHGTKPTDSFQERAEPYLPWATREYVVVDGPLPLEPLTLDPPYPCTRSGFVKASLFVTAKAGIDLDALQHHWFDVHAPSVVSAMEPNGGFRYVINLSIDPSSAPYFGMAELYFPDTPSLQGFLDTLPHDGITDYFDRLDMLTASTEMVGIP
jgi:hypothetical protein